MEQNMAKEHIGIRVKKLMDDKGLKQQQLGDLIGGVSHQSIHNLTSGKIHKAPRYVDKLAKVLGVTVDYLMSGETAPYQTVEQTHDLLATDRPTEIDFNDSVWVISVPVGEELILPAHTKMHARVLKKYSAK
jgi:transcriptional regulator with XRE-family HTH domain